MNLSERTLRNADVISPQEQAVISSARVLVAGCGSVGGSVAEPLVRLGLTSLVVADPEVYEPVFRVRICMLCNIRLSFRHGNTSITISA
jgi:molybdopterin/thiamine biosynthesis adenylyltransferase